MFELKTQIKEIDALSLSLSLTFSFYHGLRASIQRLPPRLNGDDFIWTKAAVSTWDLEGLF